MSIEDTPTDTGPPPFDEAAIRATVARYQREYDRYLKLCARVADICRLEIVEGSAIRAQVTSRAKTPKSLESKLRRIVAANKKPLTDIDSVFLHVRDLAAVRIATYEHRREEEAVDLVCRRFHSEAGVPPIAESKDYQRDPSKVDNYYRATHIEAFLLPTDLVGTYANVKGVPCEIQVCSMMAHVWNEIEHDLAYKPYSGTLSPLERSHLVNLGDNVRIADRIISQLLAETERRQAAASAADAPFADVHDFIVRVRPWFPGVDFGRHANALLEVLRPLRLLTIDSLRKAIDLPDPIADGARKRLTQLRDLGAKAVAGGSPTTALAQLDERSSDLLLVALLPRLARFLAPDGSASDSRVRRIAEDYLAFVRIAATLPPPASDA